jgi:hypothetical protein
MTFEEEKAETKKILAAQRQDVDRLLIYLKLTQRSFRDIWLSDLARGSALAQKIIPHRPEQESEYQQAYDLLSAQATGFAWTFKPNMLEELANYFEVYWSMAELASIFTATQDNKSYQETFIAQVQALGEPDNLGQAKASIINPLRSLVRSISLKFGYPKEPGKICWIGFSNIQTSVPVEQMIRLIQSENDQRRVLFETLSWGVLQVYQNAEALPKPEQNLGRNLVLSYLISAKQTIQKPTHPVEYELSNVEYLEFRFKRLITEQERTWLATAQVRVTRTGGRVNLYGYGFEESRELPQ